MSTNQLCDDASVCVRVGFWLRVVLKVQYWSPFLPFHRTGNHHNVHNGATNLAFRLFCACKPQNLKEKVCAGKNGSVGVVARKDGPKMSGMPRNQWGVNVSETPLTPTRIDRISTIFPSPPLSLFPVISLLQVLTRPLHTHTRSNADAGLFVAPGFVMGQIIFLIAFTIYLVVGIIALVADFGAAEVCVCAYVHER